MSAVPIHFICHHTGDDVAVAVVTGQPAGGQRNCWIMDDDTVLVLDAADPIPLGHKVALRDIAAGALVHKYGSAIGKAARPIRSGEHVHVHNLASTRW